MKFLLLPLFFSLSGFSQTNENLQKINASYLEKIRPIFKRTCFDCHSDQVIYPWYYKIPGIKQFIDHDIKEGLEHLDMSKDYPFKGSKKGLQHDMKEIWEDIEDGEMPPIYYRIMSKDRRLSDEEKEVIRNWVEESIRELGK